MDRKVRRQMIAELVNNHKVTTQEDLLKLLTENGINASQATISRDMHAMDIVKVSDHNGNTYYAQINTNADHDYSRLYAGIANNVVKITTVQFLNVVQTTLNSTYATVLAGIFDEFHLPMVVGTLAGNDTLVLISKNDQDAQAVHQLIVDHMRTN